jgi:ribonuclease J
MGIDPKNVFIGDNGRVLETDGETMAWNGTVTAGKVLVDGLGVGDVGSVVLRDRKHLAQDGLIVVVTTVEAETWRILSGPDIVSRGFVYVRESEEMIVKARSIARESIRRCMEGNTREWGLFKQRVKDDLGDYFWQVTKRNPMILPVIQEI